MVRHAAAAAKYDAQAILIKAYYPTKTTLNNFSACCM